MSGCRSSQTKPPARRPPPRSGERWGGLASYTCGGCVLAARSAPLWSSHCVCPMPSYFLYPTLLARPPVCHPTQPPPALPCPALQLQRPAGGPL